MKTSRYGWGGSSPTHSYTCVTSFRAFCCSIRIKATSSFSRPTYPRKWRRCFTPEKNTCDSVSLHPFFELPSVCMTSANWCMGRARTAALRFFRTCLRLNNNNLLNHLKKHRVFSPILKLTLRESKRDNLLSSCCQEMFEAIRRVRRAWQWQWTFVDIYPFQENYRDLIDHIMTNYESLIKELSESAIMGQRFIGLIRRWEINNEPPPRFEPMFVHVPAAVMCGDSNAPSLVLLPSRANGDKPVSPTQRMSTSMGHRTMTPRPLRQHIEAEHSAVCRSGEVAVAGVPPGLQMSRSQSHSPSAGLHSSTTKKTTNRPMGLLLHRSKIPRGQGEPRGTSVTKTRSHARLLTPISPNSRVLHRPRQAPRGSRAASRERRAWQICHPWL